MIKIFSFLHKLLYKKDTKGENIRYVVCKICGKQFGSLGSHINKYHNLSVYEYEKKFPKAKVTCKNVTILSKCIKRTYPEYEKLYYKKEHPCQTHNLIKGIHDNKVNVYKIGMEYLILCWFCAAKLGFFSKEDPKWISYEDNEININKDMLLEYAKNNPKLKISSTNYNIGQFFSNKNNKIFFYRSGLELKHLQDMEEDSCIVKFSHGLRITYYDYINTNQTRYYFVDWKIQYKDNSIKLVETKPYVLVKNGIDNGHEITSIIPKLEAVEEYCKNNNYQFEYWTEN